MKERESKIIAPSLQRQNMTLGGFRAKEMMQKLFLGHVNTQSWEHSGKCGVSGTVGWAAPSAHQGWGIIDKKCEFFRHKVAPALLSFSTSASTFFFIFPFACTVPLLILWGFSSATFSFTEPKSRTGRQMCFIKKKPCSICHCWKHTEHTHRELLEGAQLPEHQYHCLKECCTSCSPRNLGRGQKTDGFPSLGDLCFWQPPWKWHWGCPEIHQEWPCTAAAPEAQNQLPDHPTWQPAPPCHTDHGMRCHMQMVVGKDERWTGKFNSYAC